MQQNTGSAYLLLQQLQYSFIGCELIFIFHYMIAQRPSQRGSDLHRRVIQTVNGKFKKQKNPMDKRLISSAKFCTVPAFSVSVTCV